MKSPVESSEKTPKGWEHLALIAFQGLGGFMSSNLISTAFAIKSKKSQEQAKTIHKELLSFAQRNVLSLVPDFFRL